MADAIVSAILDQLTTAVGEKARKELRLITTVEEEVRKLENSLKAVHCLLADAEEKQTTNESVKNWLSRLKEASYDIEDVLDEWRTALLKLQTDPVAGASTSPKRKVCSFLSCLLPGQIQRRRNIALQIEEINGRLDEIAGEKDRYNLAPREINLNVHQPNGPRPTRETTSFMDASKIHGRDVVKQEIKSKLLRPNGEAEELIQTVSVLGIGGLGKTAVAQLVYNDDEVKNYFDKRIWVCVSDFFEKIRVAKAIIIALEGLDKNTAYILDSLPRQTLLERICSSIEGKKFFLILDDVWTDDGNKWESLVETFKRGAPGSRILITTRKETVARMMESSHIVTLDKLSQEDCWLIIRQLAFIGRNEKERQILEDVGRKISDKCKGLPLAAKTLGGLLQFKKTKEDWRNILNSDLWKLESVQQGIFVPLLLSYNDLPSPIRLCFMYCAIFPKDFLLWRGHTIYHWMAQGYLGFDDNMDLGSIGNDYFDTLAARSFFQDFQIDGEGSIYACKMHDIAHDFAQFLTKDEFVTLEVNLSHGKTPIDLSVPSRKARHLTLMLAEGTQLPSTIYGAEKLRSLVTFTGEPALADPALRSLFKKAKNLRLLDLSWPDLWDGHLLTTEEIPKEIGKLIHLRHINLSSSRSMKRLPEAIGELLNLQYLDLKGCRSLETLPDSMGQMTNLRYFRTAGCESLTYYPKGIGRLTFLSAMTHIIARADRDDPKEFSIGDFEELDRLHHSVWVKLVGNSIDAGEARKAKLQNKIHLQVMRINLAGTTDEDEATEKLNFHSDLDVEFHYNNGGWCY